MRVNQFADLAIDAGMVERLDNKLPLPFSICVRLPVLDGAAATGAEMGTERIDPFRACGHDMRQRAAIRMAGRGKDIDGLAAQRIRHIDIRAA